MNNGHTPSTPLREDDAARYLGFTSATLRAWRHHGRGPGYFRVGRSIRYHVADLDTWLERQRVGTRDTRANETDAA